MRKRVAAEGAHKPRHRREIRARIRPCPSRDRVGRKGENDRVGRKLDIARRQLLTVEVFMMLSASAAV